MDEPLEKLISLAKEHLNEKNVKNCRRKDVQSQQKYILKLCKNVEMFVKAKNNLELRALYSKSIDTIELSKSDEIMTVLYEMSLISPLEYSEHLLQSVNNGDLNREKSKSSTLPYPSLSKPEMQVKWKKMKKVYGIK